MGFRTVTMMAGIAAFIPIGLIGAQVTRPVFEVASIKRTEKPQTTQVTFPPGGFVALSIPIRPLIGIVYSDQPDTDVIGGPDWLDIDPFDIQAKTAEPQTQATVKLMVRALLEDRFGLRIRPDKREVPMYSLGLERSGALGGQLRPATASDCTADRQAITKTLPVCGFGLPSIRDGARLVRGYNVTMGQIANNLKPFAGRPVIDRTGLGDSRFSFELRVPLGQPPPPSSPGAPVDPGVANTSFVDALKEQLGLKLDSTRGLTDVLVIEAVQRPTVN